MPGETNLPVPAGAYQSPTDLFAPDEAPSGFAEGGKGSEDVSADEVIIPRASLLQAMSKVITEKKLPGAEPGVWWLSPLGRPLNSPSGKDGLPTTMQIVVARILPGQKYWRKVEQGGGIVCESVNGQLTAVEPNGLRGATIAFEKNKKKEVTAVDWEGGKPTNDCSMCVYGLGAAQSAAGREPVQGNKDRATVWLPKIVIVAGETVKLDDKLRAPVCTPGIDVIALVLVPAFNGLPAEVMPMMMTFARTSWPAGKQLQSLIKLSKRDAWAALYQVGSTGVTNDKGTFSVATVRMLGHTREVMVKKAEELYDDSKVRVYNAPAEDDGDHATGGFAGDDKKPVVSDSAPPPDLDDKF